MLLAIEDFVQCEISAPEILASESLVPENPPPGFPELVGMGLQALIIIALRFLDGRIDRGAPGASGGIRDYGKSSPKSHECDGKGGGRRENSEA
jgi:hypothetical protein